MPGLQYDPTKGQMPQWPLTGPDGATYYVDAPTEQEAANKLHAYFTQHRGAGPAARSALGGFNKMLAAVAGLPVDAVNAGMGAIGLPTSDKPFMGSDFINENIYGGLEDLVGAEEGTMTEQPSDDLMGRIAGRVGEELGANSIPALGLLNWGLKVAGRPAVSSLGLRPATRLAAAREGIKTMGRGIGQRPFAAAIGEGVSTAAAGVGGQLAEELYPGNPWAELAGETIGGLAPDLSKMTPIPIVARQARKQFGRWSPSQQRRAAVDTVKGWAEDQMDFDTNARLTQADELVSRIPGFNPSIGEKTGSPGFLKAQRELERNATPAEINRRSQNEAAITNFEAAQAPGGMPDPNLIIDPSFNRVQNIRGAITNQTKAAEAEQAALADSLTTTDRTAAGATIRDAVNASREAARQRMSARAEELDINDVDVTVPFNEARDQLLTEFGPKSVFDDISNSPEVLQTLRALPADKPVTFRDLQALRQRVSDDLLDATSSATPSNRRIRALTAMRQRVDQIIEQLTASADPTLADRYRQFRQEYFDQYIRPYEQGAVFKVRQRDGRGFYRLPDEQVAAAFFGPNKITDARQFKELFPAGSPEYNALEGVILDDFRDYAVRDGRISARRAETWMLRHQDYLKEFPEIQGGLANVEATNARLMSRQADLAARAARVDDSLLARQLTSMQRGAKSADAVIQSAINDPRLMRQVRAAASASPEGQNALRRLIWKQITDLQPGKITQFLDDHAESLVGVFDPAHLQALRDIDGARAMLSRSVPPSPNTNIPTVRDSFARIVGIPPEMLANRINTLNTGRADRTWVVTNLLTNILSGKQQKNLDDALRIVLWDPEAAKDFGSIVMNREPNYRANQLYTRYLVYGLVPYDQEDGQPPPEGRKHGGKIQRRASGGRAPRGIRNNNPGNITHGNFTRRRGAIGSDGRFAKFETPEQGIAALIDLLRTYENHGLTTVYQRIAKWAPANDGNNPAEYAAAVAREMGIRPDQPFSVNDPGLAQKMAAAMIRVENGAMPYSTDQINTGYNLYAQRNGVQRSAAQSGAGQRPRIRVDFQTDVNGMTPQARQQLGNAIRAAEQAGLSEIKVIAAEADSGHASHYAGTEWDIQGFNADGSFWTPEQRVAVANGAYQAGANRFGLYSTGRTLHFGHGPTANNQFITWGASGLTSGEDSRKFTNPTELAFSEAVQARRPFQMEGALGAVNAVGAGTEIPEAPMTPEQMAESAHTIQQGRRMTGQDAPTGTPRDIGNGLSTSRPLGGTGLSMRASTPTENVMRMPGWQIPQAVPGALDADPLSAYLEADIDGFDPAVSAPAAATPPAPPSWTNDLDLENVRWRGPQEPKSRGPGLDPEFGYAIGERDGQRYMSYRNSKGRTFTQPIDMPMNGADNEFMSTAVPIYSEGGTRRGLFGRLGRGR